MQYYKNYKGHVADICGKNKKFDNTIYTFDIETTSYYILNDKIYIGVEYNNLSEAEQKICIKQANMYVWQFGINDQVYYGRTWDELKEFLDTLEYYVPEKKIIFIHNLSFEFQFLKSVFHFDSVLARKSHKVMTASLRDYNIILKCTYMMSNCKLEKLPSLFNLPVEKLVGSLDYNKLRHSETPLTETELKYMEYDCLVVYYYIKYELEEYLYVNKIPNTSTGHVRRELTELTHKDYKYRAKVRKSINTDPHIYNLLVEAFMGGYTHANFTYSDEVIKDVDSYDETSAYPYVMTTHKFPATDFKKCNIKSAEQMSKKLAYILVVKFKHVRSKYFNSFISTSKCRNLKGAKVDNGRIMEAESFEMTITDVDFYFYLDAYKLEYEIIECYFSIYAYLPKQFIDFILDKYVIKTAYKGIEERKLEYEKEKAKFNALYGMSVTNMIKDDVTYLDDLEEWVERELTNDEIIDKLEKEKKKAFLSFSYGVWVTAWARDNLLRRVLALDEYTIYCDTDSLKLYKGYDKSIIDRYNENVKNRIEFVAERLGIDINRYAPADKKGIPHMLGLFEHEVENSDQTFTYEEFITQGAKKYAVKENNEIKITVAGVPKCGAKALKNLDEFRDDFVFDYNDTGKSLVLYSENQRQVLMKDYKGKELIVSDKSGCVLLPTTYVLGKAYEYASLISDNSSRRAIYKE